MATGYGVMSSLVFLIFYFYLVVWIFEPTKTSLNKSDAGKIFFNIKRNGALKSVIGRSYGRHGFALPRRKTFLAARVKYYSNTLSHFQQSRLILLSGDVEENPGMDETKSTTTNVKIGHLNIRSLKNRVHHILVSELVIEKDFDIFTISETWLNKTVTDVEVEIPGYTIYRLDRDNKFGGGVCAFVKDGYKVDRLCDLSLISESGLHQLWLKIQNGNHKSFIVCTVYRPPDTTLNCFEDELSDSFISALALNKDIYILGDLNCNLLNNSDQGAQKLLNFCTAFNLTQVIEEPTRITEASKSLIDIILVSNKNAIVESSVLPVSISDHDMVYVVLGLKKTRRKPVYITTRSFKHYHCEDFSRDISQAPWSVIDCFDDIEDKLIAFHSLFNPILDAHAPVKRVKLRGRPNPCVTDEIRALMRTRDKWRKLARKSNDPLAWSGYKNFKREVRRELRLAEKEYVAREIENNPNNIGHLWKIIRRCIPRKSVGRKIFAKDEKMVANDFNKFFNSVGEKTVFKIQSLAQECNYQFEQNPFVPRSFPLEQQFSFRPVEQCEIQEIILSMPTGKAPGVDKIPLRVIKDCLPAILPPLTGIINASFMTETYPVIWKKAEVVPILKNGDHEEANNNRPISLLPIFSKICERTALKQFMPFLVANDLLSTKQSGNKKWHSTETSLIRTTDFILNAMDKRKTTAIVLLDMSKAFDSINHSILLKKLQYVGMSRSVLRWFNSYLSNRSQVVRIHSSLSDSLSVVSGVPQGSILGPVLFNIYVNDLPKIPQSCSIDCYVDDTKLYMCFPVCDAQIAIANMNDDLRRIRNWCFENLLLLNPEKTELIVYGSRQMVSKLPDFQLSFLGKVLTPAKYVKDLGVVFDCNLNFDEHVLKTVSSCMSGLGQISRVKHAFTNKLLVTLINSLVFSKLYYCSNVWSNTSDRNIRKLQGIQNFAARIVSGTRKYDHITPVLKELKWIPVKLQLYYREAVMVFKCMTGTAPTYLSSQFVSRGSITGRMTRQASHLNAPLFKSVSGQRTFHFRAVKLWNDLCPELKISRTIREFKRKLKRILFDSFLS